MANLFKNAKVDLTTTNATTYKLQIACQSGGEFFLNRSKRNDSADSTCSSSITLSEVAS